KLQNALSAGHRQEPINQNGAMVPAMTIPFDSDRAAELFKFITQGLLYYHFGVMLDRRKHGVWAGFLHSRGETLHQKLLALNSQAQAQGDIGNGAFIYEGAQGTDRNVDLDIYAVWGTADQRRS